MWKRRSIARRTKKGADMRLPGASTRRLVIGTLALSGIAAAVVLGVGVSKGAKRQQRSLVPHFRRLDRDAFRTSLSKVAGGGETDGQAQEDYDNRAYPATSIAAEQQLAAARAADAISRLPGGKATNWQEVGPSGVPADALVA